MVLIRDFTVTLASLIGSDAKIICDISTLNPLSGKLILFEEDFSILKNDLSKKRVKLFQRVLKTRININFLLINISIINRNK